jgi:hypothetical protein
MKSTHSAMSVFALSALALTLAAPLGGCEKKAETAKPAAGAAAAAGKPATSDGHDHGHGPSTALGEQTVGGFTIRASRDGGIKAGGDAPIDAWVTGGTAKVAAVRFWIGSQDAKGSVKAKAALEKDNWHTHVEIPSPLPADSKLYVEIESDKGEKTVAGFDLKL